MPVNSSSPSPCRRADKTLPRPQLDQEYKGRHRAERVLNTEVPYDPRIGRIVKTYVGSRVPAKPLRFELWGAREVLSPLPIYALAR